MTERRSPRNAARLTEAELTEEELTQAELTEAELVVALGSLRSQLAWPTAADRSPDLAARVRLSIMAGGEPSTAPWHWSRSWRIGRRALALAIVALLALAAVAGAIGLGLPGLRLILGDAPSPPPVAGSAPSPAAGGSSAPGAELRLGAAVSLEVARATTGRPIPTFDDPSLGPPDGVYLDVARADQVALVWAASADLPETLASGVGLILMSFDGTVAPAFFQKSIGSGVTVEPVIVDGRDGFWISGDPHLFFYESGDGALIDDDRRWVGDALVWSDGATTYRLEAAIGRERAIRLAASLDVGAP